MKSRGCRKTSFNTKYSHYAYLVMSMGLCNAPATFQSLLNHILYAFVDMFLVLYIDDRLIFSKDEESYLKHLEIGLPRLKKNELFVLPTKCNFMKAEIKFLVMIVNGMF